MLAAIEWNLIGEVIWVSLVASLAVTTLFSLVVFGSSRASEARREGQNPAIYGAIAAICSVGFIGIVVFAITVILNKD